MALVHRYNEDSSDKKSPLASLFARVLPQESVEKSIPASNADRRLVALSCDISHTVPILDTLANDRLRDEVDSLTQRFSAKLSDEEKTQITHSILHAFETYSHSSETTLLEQIACWHDATAMLFNALLRQQGISADYPAVAFLLERIKHLVTVHDIQEWKNAAGNFFHPIQRNNPESEFSTKLNATDTSTTNDNLFGLFGGGAAIEYLRTLIADKKDGFIVLFHLFCLDVIRMRFGQEAVEDCLITVAANFTASLQNEDAIYHWSDSSLLAIVQDRPSEIILNAELEHVVAQHRENTIKIAGRSIMIRIPITFEIFPIHNLKTPEDLLRLINTTTAQQ